MSTTEELQRWVMVNQARTVDGLIGVLDDLGDVEESEGHTVNYGERARIVRDHGGRVSLLPRDYGIRQQYVFLKGAENGR